MHALQIQIEISIARRDGALRQNNDFRNVDGVLDVKVNRLRYHVRYVDLFCDSGKFALHRSDRQLDSFHELLESIG